MVLMPQASGSTQAIAIDSLWAKSAASGAAGCGYPLLPHLLDVAAVARELLELVPCPVTLPCNEQWLSALVGCHDLGKATPGFQAKLPGATTAVAGAPDRHDASTVPLLSQQLLRRGLDQPTAWLLANAVGAHHGHRVNPVDLQAAGRWRFTPDWLAAHDQLFADVINATGATSIPALPSNSALRSAFLQWLMGLTSVADWIGSSEAICREDRLTSWSADGLAWFASSRELARHELVAIGLAGAGFKQHASGAEALALALDGRAPRPLQVAAAEVIDQLGDQPGLVVIEAPMGEGKTEAGFALGHGRGLYLAMPTQATANALFGRVAKFLAHAAVGSVQLVLAHGAGGPAPATTRLREIGLGSADSGVSAGWWFQGSKRSLLCQYGIGSVDQGLIGVLNARHQFVRLFGLSRRTVVFDELHAYDAYTGGLIERLVAWLQHMGCRVVLMSATLPEARRDALLHAWAGSDQVSPAAAYPRITWATPGRIRAVAFPASRRQQLRLEAIDPDHVADQAAEMAQRGARVLLVVNTVARAQLLFQQVHQKVPATLFHARFPMAQRLQIEQVVLDQFGPDGSGRGGHVLVATQVAEQSLDIDMDVLLTDLAPVDLVLQRAGRIHRHSRTRPSGFDQPVVMVAGLKQALLASEFSRFVYDAWTVLRSAAWLLDHPVLDLPDDIDRAVQDVYGCWIPAPGALADAINAAWADYQNDQQQRIQLAQQAALPAPADWWLHSATPPIDDEAAESGSIQFGTRLGQESISVVPVYPHQLSDLAAHVGHLSGQYLRISNRRLIAELRSVPLPAGWRDHAGLRNRWPLLVDAAGVGPGCRIDPLLGLVSTREAA
jgi:CRISPR-associated endonuclease/helicase Cas3